MDQVKTFLRNLKRHHFWVLCVVILILGTVGWYFSVGKLAAEEDDRLRAIGAGYSSVNSVQGVEDHPNDETTSSMSELIARRRQEVQDAWKKMLDQQQQGTGQQQPLLSVESPTQDDIGELDNLTVPAALRKKFEESTKPLTQNAVVAVNTAGSRWRIQDERDAFLVRSQNGRLDIYQEGLFTWPDYSPEFTALVRQKNGFLPFENQAYRLDSAGEKTDPNDVIPKYLREAYRVYVIKELPKLAEIIGAVWTPSLDGVSTVRSDNEEPRSYSSGVDDENGDSSIIVNWNADDQQRLQTEHFDWSANIVYPPTHLQVMYAQEDLWVLTALMNIIKRTNGDVRVRHNAKIKGIETIEIGKAASTRNGEIWRPDGVTVDSGDDSAGLPEPSGPSSSDEGEPGMRDVPDPADGRYVDGNYVAISADELIGTTDPFMKVAKRMPVRMRLKIDQRAIVPLLIECANSELTVEVRQVRLNPPLDIDSVGGSSSRSLEEPGRALLNQSQSEHDLSWVLDPFPYDVTVEVYGIIYVFNTVDASALGEDTGDAE